MDECWLAGFRAVQAGSPDNNDPHTDLVDALANIMHYAQCAGLDFSDALDTAKGHFNAERMGK